MAIILNYSKTGLLQRPGTAVPGAAAVVFPRGRFRAAFTLLEVILALALSILVLGAIGFALSSQLRFLDRGRQSVEEAQLARSILSYIADDLRNVVPYQASSTEAASSDSESSTTPAAGTTSTGAKGDETTGETGSTDASATETSSDTDAESQDLSTSAPQSTPGLFGNTMQLEIDVSRLPRRDQLFSSINGDAAALQSPMQSALQYPRSDMKNVVYYLVGRGTAGAQTPAAPDGQQGLYRRELDRTIALAAAQQGDQATLLQGAEVMAPEVASLRFRYFDGLQWLETWNSTTYGGLPAAVEIRVAFERPPTAARSLPTTVIYRLTVLLPAAQPLSQTTSESTTDSTMSSTESPADTGGSP